jgi:hypothetical protein
LSIESDDLDAAVAAGVVPQAQADALRIFVAERRSAAPKQVDTEDERFRFMTGFNDFFFAIGILLLGFGMAFFTGGEPVPSLVAVIIVWGLSELLVRRMRLVLPGILLALFFIFFVFLIVPTDLSYFTDQRPPSQAAGSGFLYRVVGFGGPELAIASKALLGTAAAALYYWRFRLPFALLPIAGSLVIVATSLIVLAAGPLSAITRSLMLLACGVVVFVIAMSFDLSDRNRVTRRSDCAFWLHLLAAPLIVHSLVSMVAPQLSQITNAAAIAVITIVTVLASVAIAIDRRALLVSALIYVGAVIAYVIGGPAAWLAPGGQSPGGVYVLTLLILGTFVISLGVGWRPLRRLFIRVLPGALGNRLPPEAAAA